VGYIRFSFVCLRATLRVKLYQKHESAVEYRQFFAYRSNSSPLSQSLAMTRTVRVGRVHTEQSEQR
jgi:hypothetical protein